MMNAKKTEFSERMGRGGPGPPKVLIETSTNVCRRLRRSVPLEFDNYERYAVFK